MHTFPIMFEVVCYPMSPTLRYSQYKHMFLSVSIKNVETELCQVELFFTYLITGSL